MEIRQCARKMSFTYSRYEFTPFAVRLNYAAIERNESVKPVSKTADKQSVA
jgi:hypothetical protein